MARARSLSLAAALLLFAAAAAPREAAAQAIDPRDRDTLLAVKAAFTNGKQNLYTWKASDTDCRKWNGIACDESGRVIELDLSTVSYGLKGSISPAIGKLAKLNYLLLGRNFLTGSIPNSIGNLTNLQVLYLAENSLTGSIPDSIGNLTNLYYLNLASNSLTGSIPDFFGNFGILFFLYLDSNSLRGTIPNSIGNLAFLSDLDLSSNKLEGRVPGSISKLTGLERLYLNNNKLTGSITLVSDDFSILNVQDNYFSGPINITKNGRPYCVSNHTNNCIYRDITGCGATQKQRPKKQCAAFYQSGSPEGACGGHGTCGYDTATCTCDKGYALASGTCASRSPPPRPPPPRPRPPSKSPPPRKPPPSRRPPPRRPPPRRSP